MNPANAKPCGDTQPHVAHGWLGYWCAGADEHGLRPIEQPATDEPPLVDPDCRDGKCGSCMGGPCECTCHRAGRTAVVGPDGPQPVCPGGLVGPHDAHGYVTEQGFRWCAGISSDGGPQTVDPGLPAGTIVAGRDELLAEMTADAVDAGEYDPPGEGRREWGVLWDAHPADEFGPASLVTLTHYQRAELGDAVEANARSVAADYEGATLMSSADGGKTWAPHADAAVGDAGEVCTCGRPPYAHPLGECQPGDGRCPEPGCAAEHGEYDPPAGEAPVAGPQYGVVSDDHGSACLRCGPDCDLQVVRPGDFQCNGADDRCPDWPHDDEDAAEAPAAETVTLPSDVPAGRIKPCGNTLPHGSHWWPSASVRHWCAGADENGLREIARPEAPAGDPEALTGDAEYWITVTVPARLGDDMLNGLFTAVADAVHEWEPDERDGWDADVIGSVEGDVPPPPEAQPCRPVELDDGTTVRVQGMPPGDVPPELTAALTDVVGAVRRNHATPPARHADEIRAAIEACIEDDHEDDQALAAIIRETRDEAVAELNRRNDQIADLAAERDALRRIMGRYPNVHAIFTTPDGSDAHADWCYACKLDEQRQRADAWLERAHSAYRYRYAWQSARRRAAVAVRVAAERDAAIERADYVERERDGYRDTVARVQAELGGAKGTVAAHDALIRELRTKVKARDEALAKRDDAIHRVQMVKVWTNEDGKRFVFADDLLAALADTGGETR